jgi:hypothetical protein
LRLEITPPYDFTIGRSDPAANILPSLDLGQYGAVPTYISRRHALISWQNGVFIDMGIFPTLRKSYRGFLLDFNAFPVSISNTKVPPHPPQAT